MTVEDRRHTDGWARRMSLFRPPAARRVLVVAPHPDDEAVGCGGYLCRLAGRGAVIDVLFVTDGGGDAMGRTEPAAARVRRVEESRRAGRILGLRRLIYWCLPDGRLDAIHPPLERLRMLVDQADPDVLLVPHRAEAHPDHAAVAGWCASLHDPTRRRPRILTYEIWTPLEPVCVVDATGCFRRKLAAVGAYASQCGRYNLKGLAAGLNRYRAAWARMRSWRFAEAFGTFSEDGLT